MQTAHFGPVAVAYGGGAGWWRGVIPGESVSGVLLTDYGDGIVELLVELDDGTSRTCRIPGPTTSSGVEAVAAWMPRLCGEEHDFVVVLLWGGPMTDGAMSTARRRITQRG